MLKKIRVIGGGARNNIWNQIKADILEMNYEAMENTSFEILGNYLISRYKSDIWKGYRDLFKKGVIKVSEKIKPVKEKVINYRAVKEDYRRIVEKIGSIYREYER